MCGTTLFGPAIEALGDTPRFHLALKLLRCVVGVACLSSLLGAGPPALPPLKANVTETLLGPYAKEPYQVTLFVSPDGGHAAIPVKKGSREAIMVDGAEGPAFDEVPHGGNGFYSICFSPDGKRCAYLGRRGKQVIAVVDGKEQDPVGALPDNSASGISTLQGMNDRQFFHFSQDGSHLAHQCCNNASSPWVWNMVLDGKKSEDYLRIEPTEVAFAGDRLLFAGNLSDGCHLVINETPGAVYDSVESLQVSSNGKHYAYVAHMPEGSLLVIDGTEGKHYPKRYSSIILTDEGAVAYITDEGTLIVDDQEITSDPIVDRSLVISPDGKRMAYIKAVTGGKAAVIDGNEGPQYEYINGLQFSSSGKHVAYIGHKGLDYVVVDGQESEGARIEKFRFSADGEHYAYVAFKDRQAAVVVDGKEGPKYSELPPDWLTLSADGKRWAYGGSIKGKWQVTVNDEATPVKQISQFQARAPGAVAASPIMLSPDASRVAFVASGVKNSPHVIVYLDGKPAASGGTYSRSFQRRQQALCRGCVSRQQASRVCGWNAGPCL